MSNKAETVFVCSECGYVSPKWMGRCICGAWNSFVEQKVVRESDLTRAGVRGMGRSSGALKKASSPVKISEVTYGKTERTDTGIGELNRVLGGGMVPGSLVLISGEPGIGKSTLIIQAAAAVSKSMGKVLYVSGEESEEQIKLRADRVCRGNLDNLYLLSETDMSVVLSAIDEINPALLIIDSVQTMYTGSVDSAPGSVSQVRAVGNILMNIAKGRGISVFAAAHVTKSGELAGPRTVEHMVDTVLQFTGDRFGDLRILRSLKNRFGTTSEIGAFEMREDGLAEIKNLSGSFLEGLDAPSEGAAVAAVYEGTRPLLLEIQALTAAANLGFARRTAVGVNANRLSMIIAVLEKSLKISLLNRDVYVNVAGGLRPEGTTTDLAVAIAIWSSEKRIKISPRSLFIGEIGLTGALRPTGGTEKLLKEAMRMGFDTAVLPEGSLKRLLEKPAGIRLLSARGLSDAISIASSQSTHKTAL